MSVRVAIVDSGVNPAHPHVGGVAGGVAIESTGETAVYLDYLGHGTAVAGAIREKAPEAQLFAVKVFDRTLSTTADRILRALEWCIAQRMQVVNLSLGTRNQAHRAGFEEMVQRATAAGVTLVAAHDVLPGALPGVIAVALDWDCPRESYRCLVKCGRPLFFASGYPRAIPGVPPDRNLNGISFAVANMTGFVARASEARMQNSPASLQQTLIEGAIGNR